MEKCELSAFFGNAFDAFPGLRELIASSPGTLAVWGKTLETIALQEAASVLDRWIVGTLDNPPVGFRRESFALDVRAVVGRDRSDAARRSENSVKINRGKYVPSHAFISIAEPFSEILELRRKTMVGELTAEECDWRIHDIVEGAFAGSVEKLCVLRARVEAGEHLYHPGDETIAADWESQSDLIRYSQDSAKALRDVNRESRS